MEFVVWDDGIICDDEDARECELSAGILYFWKQDEINTGQLFAEKTIIRRSEMTQTVGFLRAIINFVKVCGQRGDSNLSIMTTLSENLVQIQQIGSQLFMAILQPIDLPSKNLKDKLGSLLNGAYGIFCLFHGSLSSMLARPIENIDIDGIFSGMDLLMALQSIRKQIRKLGRHDRAQSQDGGGDSKALKIRLDYLESFSPMKRIFEISEAFFPLYFSTANTLTVDSIYPMKGIASVFNPSIVLSVHSFRNRIHFAFEQNVQFCSIFYQGNLLSSRLPSETLKLLCNFLRLREWNALRQISSADISVWASCSESHSKSIDLAWASMKFYQELLSRENSVDDNASSLGRVKSQSGFLLRDGSYSSIAEQPKKFWVQTGRRLMETDIWSAPLYTSEDKCDADISKCESHIVIWKVAGLTFIVTLYIDDGNPMDALKRGGRRMEEWETDSGFRLSEENVSFLAEFEAFCIDQQARKLAKHLQSRFE